MKLQYIATLAAASLVSTSLVGFAPSNANASSFRGSSIVVTDGHGTLACAGAKPCAGAEACAGAKPCAGVEACAGAKPCAGVEACAGAKPCAGAEACAGANPCAGS